MDILLTVIRLIPPVILGVTLYNMAKKSRFQRKQFEESMRQMNEARGNLPKGGDWIDGQAFTTYSNQPADPQGNAYLWASPTFSMKEVSKRYPKVFSPGQILNVGADPGMEDNTTRVSAPRTNEQGQKMEAYYCEAERRVYLTYPYANGGYSSAAWMRIDDIGPDARVCVEFEAGARQSGYQTSYYMLYIGGRFSGMTGDDIDEYAHRLPKWEPSIIV